MQSKKIILLGSPQISIACFEQIINNFNVLAIITQPDQKKGRGLQLQETPVSEFAKKHHIKLFKPNKIIDIYDELLKLDFDILLTFAYGQFIPTKILQLAKIYSLNIHGSLLPKYRGAAPIHWAILNGDKEIGITLIEMIKEMDAGQMFYQASKTIDDQTTTGDGFTIISQLARDNIVKWIKNINASTKGKKQSKDFTLAPKITKDFAELNTSLTIKEAKRKIKGLNPFPGAFIIKEQQRIKIFDFTNKKNNSFLKIKFKDGELNICDFQKENKKRLKIC